MFDFMNITEALADENRVRILMALDQRELCVCQIIDLLQLSPSTVSKHLSILRNARLINSRKAGRWIFELFKAGELYEHVIAVCHSGEAQCPIFPGITKRWHDPFEDPAAVEGDHETRIQKKRLIRDSIKDWIVNPPPDTFSYRAHIKN